MKRQPKGKKPSASTHKKQPEEEESCGEDDNNNKKGVFNGSSEEEDEKNLKDSVAEQKVAAPRMPSNCQIEEEEDEQENCPRSTENDEASPGEKGTLNNSRSRRFDKVNRSNDIAGVDEMNGSHATESGVQKDDRAGERSACVDNFPTSPKTSGSFSFTPLATNLDLHDKTTWAKLLKWLPSSEEIQRGYFSQGKTETDKTQKKKSKDDKSEPEKVTHVRGDDAPEVVEEKKEWSAESEQGTSVKHQHPTYHHLRVQPSAEGEQPQNQATTARFSTTTCGLVADSRQLDLNAAAMQNGDAKTEAESSRERTSFNPVDDVSELFSHLDERTIEKVEVVNALRTWVIMQPVDLRRPLGPDNPTYYSLYLQWWEKQKDGKDGLYSPGRTSSLLEGDLDFPTSPGEGNVSTRGRPRKTPSHLSSFELFEEGWSQGKQTKSNKKKSVTEELKAIEKEIQSQLQRDDPVRSPLGFGSAPISSSKRKKRASGEDKGQKRQKTGKKEVKEDEENEEVEEEEEAEAEKETATPKRNARGRGKARSQSLPSVKAKDADLEGEGKLAERKKRRRESEKDQEASEIADPTFVPASPAKDNTMKVAGKESNGKKASNNNNKKGGKKKDDKLRHLKPATVESCHRCKNRKEYWMGCPIVEAHRYCKGCVERHFSIDYEANSGKSAEIWADGCPICKLTCQCAACRRRKDALDAGLSPPSKRRRTDGDADYGDNDNKEDQSKARRTRSQSRSADEKKENGNTAGEKDKKKKEGAPRSNGKAEEQAKRDAENAMEEDDGSEDEKKGKNGNSKSSSRMQTRSRTKEKVPSPSYSPEEEDDFAPAPAAVRQENGYYVLEDSDNVEAFVGLTGAGSVLSRRYSAPATLLSRASVKITGGGGW